MNVPTALQIRLSSVSRPRKMMPLNSDRQQGKSCQKQETNSDIFISRQLIGIFSSVLTGDKICCCDRLRGLYWYELIWNLYKDEPIIKDLGLVQNDSTGNDLKSKINLVKVFKGRVALISRLFLGSWETTGTRNINQLLDWVKPMKLQDMAL